MEQNNVIINNALVFPVPNGFHVMDEAELREFGADGRKDVVWFSDPAANMKISVGWRKARLFKERSKTSGELAKDMEDAYRAILTEENRYGFLGFITMNVGGRTAEGFDSTFKEDDGTPIFEECLILRDGKEIYNLHVFADPRDMTYGRSRFGEALAGCIWKR